jgi:hypothetical protein
MKNNSIKYISVLLLAMFLLSSCFKEKDPIYEVVGPVATIPVFTLSATTVDPGQAITLKIRYYSENIAVSQLRLNQIRSGTSQNVSTVNVTNFNTDNSYEETFSYTVPQDAAGSTITLQVEVETANGLVNRRSGNITVR